jgi:hypothetical protein
MAFVEMSPKQAFAGEPRTGIISGDAIQQAQQHRLFAWP